MYQNSLFLSKRKPRTLRYPFKLFSLETEISCNAISNIVYCFFQFLAEAREDAKEHL